MTNEELSYEFDVLAQSYFREGGFTISDSSILAFNEYEKSVFLTREQENLVIALYSDRSPIGGFENTEQLRRSLDSLIKAEPISPDNSNLHHTYTGTQFFKLNSDVWFIVYEAGRYGEEGSSHNCPSSEDGYPVEIVPVTYDEFHRIKNNPFRGVNNGRALRLDYGKNDTENRYAEIVAKYPLEKYFVKYLKRPAPIILVDLPDGLSIDKVSSRTECQLHEQLHRMILDGAVKAAVQSRIVPNREQNQN